MTYVIRIYYDLEYTLTISTCIVEIKTLPNMPIIREVFEGDSSTQTCQQHFHFLPELCSPVRGSRSGQSSSPGEGWAEAAQFGNSWPGTLGHPQQVRPARCPGGTVCSATGRHSPTRGQEERWHCSPLPSRIHYFLLQILFSSFMFSGSTETLVLSSPGMQLFPHYQQQFLSRKILY